MGVPGLVLCEAGLRDVPGPDLASMGTRPIHPLFAEDNASTSGGALFGVVLDVIFDHRNTDLGEWFSNQNAKDGGRRRKSYLQT